MYKKASNISNPKEINQKTQTLQSYKGKRNRRNPYHPPLKCHRNNPATIDFKTEFPKLFNYPNVQLKNARNGSPKPSTSLSKKLILNPKIKVTRRTAVYCRKDCYIQIRCLKRNFIGTHIRSPLDPNLWIWINFNMEI